MKKILAVVAAGAMVCAGSALVGPASDALANTKSSPIVLFSNLAGVQSGATVSNYTGSGYCMGYSSWVRVYWGTPSWVKNVTTITAHGLGATIGGANVSGQNNALQYSWTNNNGATGSYLSGSACANWWTLFITTSVSGSAFVAGSPQTVAVSLETIN